ncbi:MAG: ABC transporter ATP-binding protein [Planctomycetota bacterium]|nr:ABC transporter ATP-binding protein [Planctomycetota bacterium]
MTDPSQATLVVEDLSKNYDGTLALDRLSFEVLAGEILGLVGPNGAGKTTALRSIAGVLPIQAGRVQVCGHDVSLQEERAKRCIAWVPDEPQPFDTLTVDEHMEFTAALYRVSEWRPRAEELIELFELGEKRAALGGELSRGMRQKLALCCAWLPKPRVVLLDEPLSGLDPRGIRSAKVAIRELAAAGTSVILSSHLLGLIEQLADRLLILDKGRRVFVGTLREAHGALAPTPGSSLEEIFFAATEAAGAGGATAATEATEDRQEAATEEAS